MPIGQPRLPLPRLSLKHRLASKPFHKIRAMIHQRLAEVEVIQVEIPGSPMSHDPWSSIARSWQGHPDTAEFEQNLKDYRQEVDRDPQRL